jgi:hypothetical protein
MPVCSAGLPRLTCLLPAHPAQPHTHVSAVNFPPSQHLRPAQVFREDGRLSYDPASQVYGMDWFEGAIARPGQVLRDIVRAVQPQLTKEVSGSRRLAGRVRWELGCPAASDRQLRADAQQPY